MKIFAIAAEFCTFLHIDPTFKIYLLLLEYLEPDAPSVHPEGKRTLRQRLQSCISGEGGHFEQPLH